MRSRAGDKPAMWRIVKRNLWNMRAPDVASMAAAEKENQSARETGGRFDVLSRTMNRRHFLQQTLATSACVSAPAILSARSPNSMFQVASVGVGGMGGNTMMSVLQHPKVRIVGMCDVDAKTLELASLNPVHVDRTLASGDVEWIARIVWVSQ